MGAGVGGLACAIDLARQGVGVTVLDRATWPGGKMRQVQVDGQGIDAGPTVFTMPWVFEQLFDAAGDSFEARLPTVPLQVLARHAWRSGGTLDLTADVQASAESIGAFSSPAEARRFLGFCDQARKAYQALEGPYIRAQRPDLLSLASALGPRGLAVLAGLGPFFSLWRSLGRHFHDPRLRQLFGRYATYCGASPWQAPATLMLIAQVEMDGVKSVPGGMAALAHAMADLATRRGAQVRLGCSVRQLLQRGQGGQAKVCGALLDNGETLWADAVVFAGDSAALAGGLLGDAVASAVPPVPATRRSLSALTWALHASSSGFELARHNVFFEDDYAREFHDIFQAGQLPSQGTVYVCAQDRLDHGLHSGPQTKPDTGFSSSDVFQPHALPKPSSAERLLCLVNAPANGDAGGPSSKEMLACEQHSLGLMQACGLQLHWEPHQALRTGPAQFDQLFPGSGGALYGQASHGWMASFRRPGARSRLPGLYLAGGSVHPGPGVPMAALSGRLAAASLMADRALTSRWHRVVIPGGMSTP